MTKRSRPGGAGANKKKDSTSISTEEVVAETTRDPQTDVSDNSKSRLWYAAVLPSFLSFGYTILSASDLWWHIATGRLIVATGWLPLTDVWSFTRLGQPWLQHEWLSDLIFYLWTNLFGIYGLVYWKWLVLIATFVLLFYVVRRIATENSVAAYAAVFLGLATAAPFLDIRPHLYSALGYVVVLCLVLLRKRTPWFLPGIFLIWANLHGGFFFGLMAVFILMLPAAIQNRAILKRNLVIWLACVAVSVINPSGIYAFAYPLKYAFDRSSPFPTAIAEWLSPFVGGGIQSPLYPYCISVFVISGIILFARRSERLDKRNWSILALGLLTLAMSLASRRFIVLFAITQSVVTARAIAIVAKPYIERIPEAVPLAAVFIIGIVLMLPFPLAPYAFHYLTSEDDQPIEAANFIDANELSGNVFAHYNWGGYLHFRTNGRIKVFIDGRADTVYDDATFLQYSHVHKAFGRVGRKYSKNPRPNMSSGRGI